MPAPNQMMAEAPLPLGTKLHRALAQWPHIPRALELVWAAAPAWTGAWLALLALQGLLPVATVTLTRRLVDGLVDVMRAGGGWAHLHPLLLPAALMAGTLLTTQLVGSVAGQVRAAQSDLVRDHIAAMLHRQSIAVDLAFYDQAEYYDRLHRARVEGTYRPVALVESLGSLLQNGITLVAMGAVLIPYGPWLPLALLTSTVPALYVVLLHNTRQHQWERLHTADERRTWYCDWLFTAREAAAELRLLELGDHFHHVCQAVRQRLRGERLQLARGRGLAELGAGLIGLVVTGAAMAWMVWRASLGTASLGDVALFYQAFSQGQGLLRSLLGSVGQVYSNSLFLGDLFQFLGLESQVVDPSQPAPAPSALREGIRFHKVTFGYPDSERPALRDFNLTVSPGRIAAIVGPNGAGKSTLIKLLCRLYDPQSGSIELDGVDLRHLEVAGLRRLIAVLFQEPIRYYATVAENIALGDILASPGAEQIRAAALASGAEHLIAHLPQGYDTLLGRMFAGGTELSVGEWQRVALARALVRRCPIIILDEPTSAMDPWAEAEWTERFRELANGRTAIIITHRLTTALHADIIHVMEDGQIVESGTHDELVAAGGLYARSWTTQARGHGEQDTQR